MAMRSHRKKKNPRLLKLWSERHLPEELWPIILSNLPVKTLLRFRSVSPSWRALIDSPDFALQHLTRSTTNPHPTHLFLGDHIYGDTVFNIRCAATLKFTARFSLFRNAPSPPTPDQDFHWKVISIHGGLFMLREVVHFGKSGDPKYMLWNPSTRKTRILPALPPNDIPIQMQFLDLGIGFDPLAQDYKFVRLVQDRTGDHLQSAVVYSVGTHSWKTVKLLADDRWPTGFKFDYRGRKHSHSLCVRGFLFAVAAIRGPGHLKLLSFDLSTMVFASTELPLEDCSGGYGFTAPALADTGSSLAVIGMSNKGRGSIWVLEGFGADSKSWSWSKCNSFESMLPGVHTDAEVSELLYIRKNEEMLLCWTKMTTSYNLQNNEEKIIMKRDLSSSQPKSPYIESLVLLK